MSVLAVPCNKVLVLSQKQGEDILKQIENSKFTKEEIATIRQQANELRRKPDKNERN